MALYFCWICWLMGTVIWESQHVFRNGRTQTPLLGFLSTNLLIKPLGANPMVFASKISFSITHWSYAAVVTYLSNFDRFDKLRWQSTCYIAAAMMSHIEPSSASLLPRSCLVLFFGYIDLTAMYVQISLIRCYRCFERTCLGGNSILRIFIWTGNRWK